MRYRSRRGTDGSPASVGVLLFDIAIIGHMVFNTGKIESVFYIFYPLIIIIAYGYLGLGKKLLVFFALIVSYGSILFFDLRNHAPSKLEIELLKSYALFFVVSTLSAKVMVDAWLKQGRTIMRLQKTLVKSRI